MMLALDEVAQPPMASPEAAALARRLDDLESRRDQIVSKLGDLRARTSVLIEGVPALMDFESLHRLGDHLAPFGHSISTGAPVSIGDALQLVDNAIPAVRARRRTLSDEADSLIDDAEDSLGVEDAPEIRQLRSKHALALGIETVLQRHRMEGRADQLEAIAGSLGTLELTNMAKRLAAAVLTGRLMSELQHELSALGLGYLRTQMVSSGRAGVATVRLAPPGKGFKKADMSDVLSEGEQTLLGLAAFFAELSLAGRPGPIVLDDPVTGLDQENKAVMARRLTEAARDRQVIVFTHDLESQRMLAEAHPGAVDEIALTRSDGRIGVASRS
jgi:hypothetical protein